ncbi:MAG: helix-turn-helix domain-containing protein [Desulfobulbaceae bacterium]|nr:helix-turn-helix domain-containing protein [Desulfobulbaceae bacterium]
MDHNKTNASAAPLPGGVPIVRINGGQIKKIREEKGLTQLYLSEVVGVTTDTISRWENRRYPSIKLENARKLAQALEIELDEILEGKESAPPEQNHDLHVRKKKTVPPGFRIKLSAAIVLALIITGFAYWYFFPPEKTSPIVSALRILPPHVPPGQVFPVLIRVQNPAGASIALILKESIPPGTDVETGVPSFTTFDPKNNELKWISRTENKQAVFAYIARAPGEVQDDSQLLFHGSVTLKKATHKPEKILGNSAISISSHHWADTNKDGMIDDEEILAVYDLYSEIQGLRFNRDLIDDIWAGSSYRWDAKTGKYKVLE